MRRNGAIACTLAATVIAVTVTACAPAAFAHVPALGPHGDEGETATPGPEASRAIYGYLPPGQSRETYAFSVDTAVTRSVAVIVPAFPEHQGFRPEFEVAENGETISRAEDPGLDEREKEWEPFSLMNFWRGAEEEFRFEPGVRYQVSVLPGDGPEAYGRYVLVFGGPERFTAEETVRTIGYLPLIWFGAYGGASPRWNPWGLIPLAVLGVLAVLLVLGGRTVLRRVCHMVILFVY
jgi:hypothetical protein